MSHGCSNQPFHQAIQVMVISAQVGEPPYQALWPNPNKKETFRTYKWDGTKCLSLTNSRCKHNEKFGGLKAKGMLGRNPQKVRFRASYKLDTATFHKSPEGKLCRVYPELPTNVSPLPYSNWILCPNCSGLLCFFFPEVSNSNFESNGVLGRCSVFSRIPTEHWNPSFANLFL